MMEGGNGTDDSVCCCDPLKRILQQFLGEGMRSQFMETDDKVKNDELVSKLHLFYKSSVLRSTGTRGSSGKLQCRINEETLKSLKDWWSFLEGANDMNDMFKLEDCARGGKRVNISQVKSVTNDKFGNVTLELDLNDMKGQVIRWTVATGWSGYSRNACHNQLYKAEIAMTNVTSSESSFLEYRKILAAQAVSTILKKIGHQIDDTHFTCVSAPANLIGPNAFLVAGTPIQNEKSKGSTEQVPETVFSVDLGNVVADPPGVQDMLSKRLAEIKEISESRRLESLVLSSWATSLDNLTRATLHYDILYRPLEADIQLNSLSDSGQVNNSNGLFIMYNYSRILSILRKFGEQVDSGEYPALPDLHEVDFTRLCEREEELHLLQQVMEWPRVMETAVNFVRLQLNLVIICKFLFALAKAFNAFYFQIVVLVPTNASHNFPVMMARVYLIKAICKIFEDCLHILQVDHANSTSPPQL